MTWSGRIKARLGIGTGWSRERDRKLRIHRPPTDARTVPLPPATAPARVPDRTLAAAVMVGDEVAYIREWVAFHLAVGFERLDIYVNWLDRLEATHREVADFVAAGWVTVTAWPDVFAPKDPSNIAAVQYQCYAHAVVVHRGRSRWLALIDADEFLFSPVHDDVKTVLGGFEARPAVAVFWVNFGTNGHATRPEGLVIDNYLKAAHADCLLNRQFKSVVQPDRILGIFNPHRHITDEPAVCAYTETGEALGNWDHELNEPSAQLLRINHYYTKSEAEFAQRMATGWASRSAKIRDRKLRDRTRLEAAMVEDRAILRFSERTRAIMAAGPAALAAGDR